MTHEPTYWRIFERRRCAVRAMEALVREALPHEARAVSLERLSGGSWLVSAREPICYRLLATAPELPPPGHSPCPWVN